MQPSARSKRLWLRRVLRSDWRVFTTIPLEPQAEATLHAAVIAYENNQTDLLDLLDSQMAVIDVNLAWFQSMGEFAASMSDLELAVGAPLGTTTQQSTTATPEENR